MTLTRAEARARSAAISNLSYLVHLDLTGAVTDETFVSTTEASLTTTEPTVFFDLIADEVIAVEVDGRGADAEIRPGRVVVENLPTNTPVSVRILARCRYSRSGEGLHRYRDPEDGQTYLYTQYEPMDACRVYACFDQPDLKARWRFVIDAPREWHVLSNQEVVSREELTPGGARHTFAPTPPLSSFITAVIAGPYHDVCGPTWHGTVSEGDGGPERELQIPLRAFCRASLADRFDAEDVFDITMAGLTFFHERYRYPYPWGKYDQVFVPEYNLGAMENPGCVTFNEHYIAQGTPSAVQRSRRGNTILHEMCHMWFGDLVTPQWWDDLWLKESFADHEGTAALAACTEHTDAWATFASGRKAWAYEQDQMPSTHPIAADIPDVAAAKQNFDGITYAKGAAVLKQLVAFVGEDVFVNTARAYFRDHAFSSTTASDLLSALGKASGRDMSAWADAWLKTAGPSIISLHGTDLVRQDSRDATTHKDTIRPHRLTVSSFDVEDGIWIERDRHSLELSDREVALPASGGRVRILNDEDHTYAVVRFDEPTRAAVLQHLSTLHDPVTRAVAWSALWNETRDALLPAESFIEAVLTHGRTETQSVLEGLMRQITTAWRSYVPPARHDAVLERVRSESWAALIADEDPGRARLWALLFARAAGDRPLDDMTDTRLRQLADGEVASVERARDIVWAVHISRAAGGRLDAEQIASLRGENPSGYVAVAATQAAASRPGRDVGAAVWDSIWTDRDLSNEMLDATIAGFTRQSRDDVVDVCSGYFERISQAWAQRSIQMGERLAVGMFPLHVDIADAPAGATGTPDPTAHPVVRAADGWLAANSGGERALTRRILEGRDTVVRALRAQAAVR
ncbi:MAG: aminopeptidase N [Bowdeniella nasicola]|nr:aminopeptidase N [Bowdeniella nasicola]